MRCPYCRKAVRDMPVHLEKESGCSKKHAINLLDHLRMFMSKEETRRRCGVDAKQHPYDYNGDKPDEK